jgi:hypothetical protein
LRKETVDFRERKRTALLHFVLERSGVEKPHDEIRDPFAFPVIEDRQNVSVFQPGNDARLLLEALHEFRALGELAWQYLDRYVAIHGRLVGLVDGCHAPLPDLAEDTIRSERLPGLELIHAALHSLRSG